MTRETFVVIDPDAERLHRFCDRRGWLSVVGDAMNDDVLQHAGIDRAHALTTVLSTGAAEPELRTARVATPTQ